MATSPSVFNGIDFSTPAAVKALQLVSSKYDELIEDAESSYYPSIKSDVVMYPPPPSENRDALLKRYLIAENMNALKALERLKKTMAFRSEWGVIKFHAKGAAAKILPYDANPGSEAYFVDSGLEDKTGTPYLVGRLCVCSSENMHPWRHLQAALFVIERLAAKLAVGPCYQAQYLLDIRYIDFQATFSGTGGKDGKTTIKRPKVASDEGSDAPTPKALADFGKLTPGMGVLKAAMRIIQNHYPEMLKRIIFFQSAAWFTVLFKVFSLWTAKRTREKFMFVGDGWLHWKKSKLFEFIDRECVPEEFGGSGPSLDKDGYIKRAVERYEAEAKGSDGSVES